MAKSTQHKDKLGSFDEFRAPWETATGDEAEIDKPKLKRFIFNLLSDKATAQDAREDALEAVKVAEGERDEAKEQAANASPEEAQKRIAKLEKERDDLKAENEGLKSAEAERALRAEVLGDLDPKYAEFVTGSTKEELEASLEKLKKTFGLTDPSGDEEEDDEEDDVLSSRPRTDLLNPLSGGVDKDDSPIDFEKAAAQILTNRPF